MTAAPAFGIDGQAVDEARFYAVACDPAVSVTVEACAGAGKTWMLVSRILRALLDGAEPQQILAITFTRKAAGEMRERLDQWLRELSAAQSTRGQRIEALRLRGLPAAEAARLEPRLAALHVQQLQSDRAVEVRTFHGWFAQLLAQAPQQLLATLGLPAPWTLIEDTQPLADELFRRFHRRVDGDAALSRDYRDLIVFHRRDTVRRWLMSAWMHRTDVERADAAGTLEGAVPDVPAVFGSEVGEGDPRRLILQEPLRSEVAALAAELLRDRGKLAREAGDGLQEALAIADPAMAFEFAFDALFTLKAEPRKQLGRSPLVPRIQEALAFIGEMSEQHQAHLDHGRMVRLSRALLAEYRGLRRERGLVDMSDLETAALALLADPAVAGWLQERLDLRLRHLLIDEFQDTSPLQWQALFGWLSSYAGAGGGASGQRAPSVFIVGDPKQSIYRFRRAEPRVFAAAREFVVSGLGGHALACDHTRRNAPAVLAAVNGVFADAAQVDRWGPFREHTTGNGAEGLVGALPEVPRNDARKDTDTAIWRDSLTQPRREEEQRVRAIEGVRVAATIEAWIAEGRVGAGGVMVLSRTKARLADVAVALAARRIAYVMPESMPLAESPEALDLIAVLDVLASPGNDLALARALKSPLFGAGDDDLLWLSSEARRQQRSWLRTLFDADLTAGAALLRAALLLRGWHAAAAQATPHDLLDRIVAEGDFDSRLAAAVPPARRHVARQALHGLLATALEFDQGRFVSIYRFVRALKEGHLKAVAQVPRDAVQLYTVHGAKGLEADAVFIIDSRPERRNPDRGTVLIDWPVERDAPRSLAFVKTLMRVARSLQPLHAEELRELEREELDVLYVAMTRARRWLVFSRTQPFKADEQIRTWWERAQWHVAALDVPRAAGDAARDQQAWVDVLPMPPPQPPAPEAVVLYGAEIRAAALGRAVHRMLEWIGQVGAPLPRDAWPAAARQSARSFGLDVGAGTEVLRAATRIADSADCKRFFDTRQLQWAGNEVPVALDGQSLRIDRLVQMHGGGDGCGEWWVLDYKLNRSPDQLEAYRQQLEGYRRAVSACGVTGRVRAAFITAGGELIES